MSEKFGYNVLAYDRAGDRSHRTSAGNQGGMSFSLATWINNDGLSIHNIDGGELATSLKQDTMIFDLNYIKTNMGTSVPFEYLVQNNKVANTSSIYRWGLNPNLGKDSEEIITPWGGTFNPKTDIIHTAQTFDITYNNTLDGVGMSGARMIFVEYITGAWEEATAVHVLGSTGTDVTAFTGLGINRTFVISSGGNISNGSDIEFSASVDLTTQCLIPASASVSQQLIYYTPIDSKLLLQDINFTSKKLSGGGVPSITLRGYSYSYATECRYKVMDFFLDISNSNEIEYHPQQPIQFGGREVIYFTAESSTTAACINGRFSGMQFKT